METHTDRQTSDLESGFLFHFTRECTLNFQFLRLQNKYRTINIVYDNNRRNRRVW